MCQLLVCVSTSGAYQSQRRKELLRYSSVVNVVFDQLQCKYHEFILKLIIQLNFSIGNQFQLFSLMRVNVYMLINGVLGVWGGCV